jgi:hypothetical protein
MSPLRVFLVHVCTHSSTKYSIAPVPGLFMWCEVLDVGANLCILCVYLYCHNILTCLSYHFQIAVICICLIKGHTVVQLVEPLRYKLEGRGFDSLWFHWNFLLTQSFRPHYGPGVDLALTEMRTRYISWA